MRPDLRRAGLAPLRPVLQLRLGLAINAGVAVLAVKTLGAPPLAAKILGIGIGLAFVFNFLFNAFFVFRRREA